MRATPYVLCLLQCLLSSAAWGVEVVSSVGELDFVYTGGASEVSNDGSALTVASAKNSTVCASLPEAYELELGEFIELEFDLVIGSDFTGTSDVGEIVIEMGQSDYGYGIRMDVLDGFRGLIFYETNSPNLGKQDSVAPFGTATFQSRFRITRTAEQEYTLLFAGPTESGGEVTAESTIQPVGATSFDQFCLNFSGALWNSGAQVSLSNLRVETDAPNIVTPPPEPLGPNVLFITVDDLKPTLACYGDPVAITPNFDRLANEGVAFRRAYCQFPVCGASRASMTTGLMPEDNGVTGFEMIRARLPDVITIPQHFRENGYETVAVGKWHDHRTVGDGTTAVEDSLSWSLPFDYGGGKVGSSQITDRDGRHWPLAAEAKDELDEKFADGVRADLALAHIDSLAEQYRITGKPFFLGLGFARPHLPFLAPAQYWNLYERDDFTPDPQQSRQLNGSGWAWDNVHEMENYYALEVDVDGYAVPFPWDGPEEPNTISTASQKELLHGYYACTSFIDAMLGRLLDALEAEGIADETIVLVVGDHGFHLGDHLKWGKHSSMEQAARAPFILKAPGVGQSGTPSDSLITFLDIYPTLCELAGLPLPEQPLPLALQSEYGGAESLSLQGQSLLPILVDPSADLRYGAITTYRNEPRGYSYRTADYRYMEWIESDGSIRARELYDMVNDPQESVNIAGDSENALLVNWLSTKMRQSAESPGCRRMEVSPAETLEPSLFDGDADGDGLLNGHEIHSLYTDPFDGEVPAVSFPKWQQLHAVTGQSEDSDADGDGLGLLLEYMADLDPTQRDSLFSRLRVVEGAAGLELVLSRAEFPVDLSADLLASESLLPVELWSASSFQYTVGPAETGGWLHRWTSLESLSPRQFFRLKLSRPWDE